MTISEARETVDNPGEVPVLMRRICGKKTARDFDHHQQNDKL